MLITVQLLESCELSWSEGRAIWDTHTVQIFTHSKRDLNAAAGGQISANNNWGGALGICICLGGKKVENFVVAVCLGGWAPREEGGKTF